MTQQLLLGVYSTLESKCMCASPCLLASHDAKADSVKASFVSSLSIYLDDGSDSYLGWLADC